MKKKMLINVADEEESRVAIIEDGILEEFTIETASKEQIKGNLYNGVIVKVEPSLQAAFVDYGGKRHGFLPMSEIHPKWYGGEVRTDDRERRPRIQDVIKRNQKVLIQVVKEELGSKGASLSTYASLPGRYLVLMPGSETPGGISRKIEDEEERKKLKEIISQLEPLPDMGIIVRTAGLNRNKAELQRDLTYLQRLWASIEEKSQQSPALSLIYQEHDLVIRSIRDYFTPDIQEVLIDDREVYRQARDFFQAVMPRYHGRVKLYRDKKPLFSKYQMEEQLEAIYSQKVELKSGGSIVIAPTEALVAIDVNSGRATKEKGIEETAFKTNMEAAQEIARQLRLRDLGGLIVIDFIDMRNQKHIQDIEKTLRLAVKRDKARTQVARISQFGLLELSRQRLKPTILEGNHLKCPHCEGSGWIKSTVSLALMVLRRIRSEASKEMVAAVKAVLPMEVTMYLLNQKRRELSQIEEEYNITLHLSGNPVARQNEFSLEFIKREAPLDIPLSAERGMSREGVDKDLISKEVEEELSSGKMASPPQAARRVHRNERLEMEETRTVAAFPSMVAMDEEGGDDEATPGIALHRGRVFWRFSAPIRRLEFVQEADDESPLVLPPRGNRHGTGRLARRGRGWWRRRPGASTPTETGTRLETLPVEEPPDMLPEQIWE